MAQRSITVHKVEHEGDADQYDLDQYDLRVNGSALIGWLSAYYPEKGRKLTYFYDKGLGCPSAASADTREIWVASVSNGIDWLTDTYTSD